MKRLRSSDDLDSYNDKNAGKSFSGNNSARKGPISPSRYDRDGPSFLAGDDVGNRDGSRAFSRRRTDRDFDGGLGNRRKELDNRYREDTLYRSKNFCFTRRDFPKGFRSERERPRREGNVSSWRRFGGRGKDIGGDERERVGGSLRPRDGEREREKNAKSPSWSRDSGSEQSRMRTGFCGESRDSRNTMSKSKSRASPTWSKDSGSEQSKSVGNVVKKNEEELQGKSGSSSEMEEGELEPEPEPEPELAIARNGDQGEGKELAGFDADHSEVRAENGCQEIVKDGGSDNYVSETNVKSDCREVGPEDSDRKMEDVENVGGYERLEEGKDVGKGVDELHASENNLNESNGANDSGIKTRDSVGDEGDKEDDRKKDNFECKIEENRHMVVTKTLHLEEELKQDKRIDLKVKAEEVEEPKCIEDAAEGNERAEVFMNVVPDDSIQKCKDKGKSVVVTSTHVVDSTGHGVLTEGESRSFVISRNLDEDGNMERPITRGFELFSSSPVRKSDKAELSGVNKQKDEKLVLEPLDLSLGLPDALLPIGGRDANQAHGSLVCSKSVQSLTDTFCTNSDGLTMSMSFSGSQSFHHNPSCSLNHNSLDNCEQSVHSRPVFQGVDWQAQSHNDSKNRENPLSQRLSMNGNGFVHWTQALQGISNSGQAGEGRHRVAEGSSKMPNGLERQLSFHKRNDVKSPCLDTDSLENGSTYSFKKEKAKREMHGSILYWNTSLKSDGDDSFETVITHILSDSMLAMTNKFREMPGRYISSLMESIREMMLNVDKRGQLYAFRNALQNRSDITLELLKKSHRAQLQILVTLKTGCSEFLWVDNNISSSDLAEIFMNLRCKNLTCRSLVPVDECDCKVCARKDGFCSACMCLVCSKFDMASNTCSWVGCDVCLHWCHTECGLRKSYIRNGNSASGAQGTTEMQFHCVACDHPSEMFGFVKEVFRNFSREWKRKRLSTELEYVRRIFSASRDLRGKWMHEVADQMLVRLANESVDLSEACNRIISFLSECDSSDLGNAPISPGKDQARANHETAGPSQHSLWLESVYSDKPPHLERSSSLRHTFHNEKKTEKCPVESDSQRNVNKEPLFEELESIVRIKQAEAKMFQARADDARREAEGLKKIAVAKNEKSEEEYMSRITKLSVAEAENMRKKKLEEFQALERAHRDYFSMKMRMEEDIRVLLSKMETTKRNLAL